MNKLAASKPGARRVLHHPGSHRAVPLAAPSFNGRTADSGSAYRGSNPWGAAKSFNHLQTKSRHGGRFRTCWICWAFLKFVETRWPYSGHTVSFRNPAVFALGPVDCHEAPPVSKCPENVKAFDFGDAADLWASRKVLPNWANQPPHSYTK